MSILVIAEHDNTSLKSATLNTVSAARQIGEDVHVLVAGSACQPVADAAAQLADVSKVLCADSECYQHQLPESVAPLVAELAGSYSTCWRRPLPLGRT